MFLLKSLITGIFIIPFLNFLTDYIKKIRKYIYFPEFKNLLTYNRNHETIKFRRQYLISTVFKEKMVNIYVLLYKKMYILW